MRYLIAMLVIVSAVALMTVLAGPKADKVDSPTVNAACTPPEYLLADPAPSGPALPPEEGHYPAGHLDTPIGVVYVAGTTWYDMQHNSGAGKMIGVDNDGYVHLVWMKAWNSGYNPRHVYYNVWDPNTQQMLFQPGGVQINNSARAGFVCQAVTPGGFAFPAFHEAITGVTGTHSAGAMDFLPRAGAFTVTQPTYIYQAGVPLDLVWPKVALDRDSVLHMVSTYNNPILGDPQPIAYSRGIPLWDQGGFGVSIDWQPVAPGGAEFLMMDSVYTISADIACSKISDRVAIAYAHRRPGGYASQRNNDVFLRLSEDGGVTWGPPTNLSHFTALDDQRAYADASLIFDETDVLHIAFTTCYSTESGSYSNYRARIWHWDEASQAFSIMVDDWTDGTHEPGNWSLNVQRPSLSLDPVTDYLFCSYQKFDQAWWSAAGYPNADAWVTVSTNGGLNWSVGRNVTDTHPATNPAPAGQSQSERDITLADHVTYVGGDGFLHLEWELDLDAGSLGEGSRTNNTIYYQRIGVNDIPVLPLLPGMPFHLTAGRCCYGYSGYCYQSTCAMTSAPQCASLGGSWDSTLTCDTPCPQSQPYTHCNHVGGPIPDLQTVNCVIVVPIEYHITDVNVCLDLTHTYDGDVVLSLISPLGTDILLSNRRGGSGDNYTCTTFDDEATSSITQAAAPFTGSFRPEGFLSAFDGQNAVGNWILRITDAAAQNVGYLNWVCLSFSYDEILPVELMSFTATSEAEGIRVAFRTGSETNTDHFDIMRGRSAGGEFGRIASLPSQGNSSAGHDYSYLDRHVMTEQTYWYYLVDVDGNGHRTEHRDRMSSAMAAGAPLPLKYSLSAYPNPFNPVTTLRFGLKEAGDVRLEIFNVSGQQVRRLVDRRYESGTYQVAFDAKDLPSGIYFAMIRAGSFVKTEKLVLMK